MTVTLSRISDLPHALRDGQQFSRQLDGRQPRLRALNGLDRPGIGVVVADPDEPEQARRTTAADFVLWSMEEVQQFLNTLAR